MHIHSIYITLSNTYDIKQASFLVLVKVLNMCRLKLFFIVFLSTPFFLRCSHFLFFFLAHIGPSMLNGYVHECRSEHLCLHSAFHFSHQWLVMFAIGIFPVLYCA